MATSIVEVSQQSGFGSVTPINPKCRIRKCVEIERTITSKIAIMKGIEDFPSPIKTNRMVKLTPKIM